MTKKKIRLSEIAEYLLIFISAAFSILLLFLIIAFVVSKGIGSINWEFLTTVTSVRKGTVGIAGNIVNTILIIIVTMLFASQHSPKLILLSSKVHPQCFHP